MNCTSGVEKEIIELYYEGKWEKIIGAYSENAFLPWIWPTRSDLEFIGKVVAEGGGKTLISVGCGSGLLEWLIFKLTGIDVVGIELDKCWWTSKYAKHTFIPLTFVEESSKSHELVSLTNVVLLFCYFNNEKAFINYIEAFKGDCFIVIGPGPGKFTYTIPEPFSIPKRVSDFWKLSDNRKMDNSDNYIAIYLRKS